MLILGEPDIKISVKGQLFMTLKDGELDFYPCDNHMHVLEVLRASVNMAWREAKKRELAGKKIEEFKGKL